MRQQILATLAACTLACSVCAAQNEPFFRWIGELTGGGMGNAIDVSDDGSVVIGEKWRWTEASGLTAITPPPGLVNVTATAVSGDGRVIVGRCNDGAGTSGGFRWVLVNPLTGAGTAEFFPPTLGYGWNYVEDVSDDGSVVVGYMTDLGLGDDEDAYLWSQGGGYSYLGHLSTMFWTRGVAVSGDGQFVVGISGNFVDGQAFRWSLGTGLQGLGYLPGGLRHTTATGASTDGSVVVGLGRTVPTVNYSPFLWTQPAGMEMIAPTGWAGDVSGDGAVIVGQTKGDPVCGGPSGSRAMFWTRAGGTELLQDVLVARGLGAQLAGWDLLECYAVSGDGRTIVGRGTENCGGTRRGWIAYLGDSCYADCDQSTGPGVLDVFDFLCFQNSFVNSEPYACDCDTSTGAGVCDVFDFLCFQNAFVGGCP